MRLWKRPCSPLPDGRGSVTSGHGAVARAFAIILFLSNALSAQPVETVKVVQGNLRQQIRIPAELRAYLKVTLQARVSGFVEEVLVDRGSVVDSGQALVRLSAPELAARVAEAEAKVVDVASRKAEAAAKLAAARSTYDRLNEAAKTPGVIAPHEMELAEQQTLAAEASLKSIDSSEQAASAAVRPLRELLSYLEVKAPFDGVITERLIDPGALAGPGSGETGLLELEQVSRLRLLIAVPEADVAGIVSGAAVKFRVPAYPGRDFPATVARIPHALDPKTRSMAVEADVDNARGVLAPGMYAEVDWPVRRAARSLLVPRTAVATTTERTFVIRVSHTRAEWVDVTTGVVSGDQIEVFGPLTPGDEIVRRATDEIREGGMVGR